ncbi:hypothetical protein M885DRAFT_158905 [Pelagophyceae sp. CCMP2097]|nr:hypothetical protein M885DRAFT_158905 [Pelagophyceae sp. CCMP2097]
MRSLRGRRKTVAEREHSEINGLCNELSSKVVFETRTIFARGLPGVLTYNISSAHAIETLLECDAFNAMLGPEATAEQRSKKAVDLFQVMVERGLVEHVSRRQSSIDVDVAVSKTKAKISAHTMFKFNGVKFSPWLLHVLVVGVRGLGEDANAGAYLEFNNQQRGFSQMRDEDDSPTNAVYVPVAPEYEIYGFDPHRIQSTDVRVGVTWCVTLTRVAPCNSHAGRNCISRGMLPEGSCHRDLVTRTSRRALLKGPCHRDLVTGAVVE